MKGFKKIFLLLLTLSLVTGSLYSTGWAGDKFRNDDPVAQGWGAIDLLVARPLGVAAAIGGTGVFIASLPFTLTVDIISNIAGSPAGAMNSAAKMFMLAPLKFSFVREFPDEDI
ncbi:MAG: hypothetical protein ABSG71_10210 [Thermodesulfobacteriota bacterium]|jgi:hypothetical protein